MPQPDNVKALYNELKNTYELGSEEDFIKYLSDDKNREALRKELESEYDVGDIASFSNYLGFGTGQAAYEQYMAQRNGQSAPAAPTAAPKQPVKPMGAAATLPSWKTSAMPDDVRKRFERQEAQPLGPERFQKQMEMQQAVGAQMQSFNNKMNAISENGKPFGKPIDALAPARQQRLQKEANDKLNESLNIATLGITQNTQPAREAWNQAGLRTQKDWRFGKLISNEASYLKNHDLDRMSEEAWNNIPTDRKQTAIRKVSQVLREQNPELSYSEALQIAERIVRAKSDQMMYDMAVEQNAPKGWLDYLTRKINDNAIGSILEGVARHKAGTIGDMQAREEATQQYANDNWFGGLVGDVAAMTLAPEMWIGGGVAGGALKGGTAIAGRAAGKSAVREGMSTLAGRMATKGLTSGVNLATFNAIGEAAGQAKHGGKIDGVDEETGRYVIGDYSLGDVGKSALHGLGLGVVTGPTGELIGNVGTKFVNRTASTVGKAAIRGSQALASTVAEGTIFVAPEILSGDITFDDWKHSVEMMAAFKLQGGLKSAKERIAELRGKRENSRQGFETRLRTMLDKSPNLALTKDEKAELERGGYKDLAYLVEGYKNTTTDQRKAIETRQPIYLEPNENGEIPFNRFIDLVEDKNISEAARAKMYYYVTGHGLPQHTIVGSNFTEHTDEKGNTTYNVQSFSRDNGIVTSRTFKNKKEAENELARINRQAELNGVDMGEKHYNELGDAERMKDAYDIVAEQKGISGEALRRKLNRRPEEMDATEKAWAKEVQQAYDNLPQDAYKTSDDVRKAINSEYDVDVDDVLKKERARRTEKEQEALEEYTKRLFADVMPKEGQPNGTNDATRLLEGSGYDGVQQRISDDADMMAAEQREEAKKKQFRGEGENKGALRPVKIKQQNGEPREVFLTQGEIVLTDNGLVDHEKTKEVNNVGTLTGYDPATGEEVQFTPADIVEVEPMTTAEQQEQNIEANKQAYIQQQMDAATPTATTTDPKATTSATTADNQQQEPAPAKPKGEPKEFAPGMVLTVKNNVDGNGEERKVVVVDGERYRLESMVPPKYVPSVSGNYVKVMDEEGNEFFLNKSIDYTITDYQEPVSEEQPTEAVEPTEPPSAEVPTAEGITPQQQVTPESTPEPAPVEKADPMKAPMPMKTVGRGENKHEEEDWMATTPERAYTYLYEEAVGLGLPVKTVDNIVANNLKKAQDKVKRAETATGSIVGVLQKQNAAKAEVEYWEKVQKLRSQAMLAASEAEAERTKEQRAAEAQRAAERREQRRNTEVGEAGSTPAEKYNSSNKIVGNKVSRTIADKTKIKGHYVLVEADALTPSHDPFNGWKVSEGFPTTEDGKSVNDRVYEGDKEAQDFTESIAQVYDGQAVSEIPVVSSEGIVYDGNGRTMAGQIAARNNTDAEYIEALMENTANFGFTEEQVQSMSHPRVVMQVDEDMPYNATTFARFNKDSKKKMNNVNKAVSIGKQMTDSARDAMLEIIDRYGTIDTFFGSEVAAADVVNMLVDGGFITQQEVPAFREKNSEGKMLLSADGRSFVTNTLLGTLFDEEAIRKLGNDKGLQNSLLRAIPQIAENRRLGEYALTDEINTTIDLLYEARKSGMTFDLFKRQGNLVEGLVEDRYEPMVVIMADLMSSGVDNFREFLTLYNQSAAADAASGGENLFGRRTKEDLKNAAVEYYKAQRNGQSDNTQAAAADTGRNENAETQPGVGGLQEGEGDRGAAAEQPAGEVEEAKWDEHRKQVLDAYDKEYDRIEKADGERLRNEAKEYSDERLLNTYINNVRIANIFGKGREGISEFVGTYDKYKAPSFERAEDTEKRIRDAQQNHLEASEDAARQSFVIDVLKAELDRRGIEYKEDYSLKEFGEAVGWLKKNQEQPESKTEVKAPNNDEVKGQEATEEPKKTELKVTFGFDTNSSLGRDILPLIKKWQDTFINIMHRRRGYAKQNNKFKSLGEKNGWERYRDADLYAVFDSNGNLIDFADSPRGAYDIALNSDVESFYVVRQQPTEDGYQYNGTTGWLFTNDIPESEWRDNQGKLREEVKAAATRSIEEALPTVMQPKEQKTGGEATKTSKRDRGLLEVVMDKLRNIIGDRLHTTLTEDEKGLINWANAKTKGTAPVFYSNAERAVEGIKQEKATAEQWLAMIQKAGGLKAGEDKWMGLSEWLNDHKGKSLTKQQVLDYIRDNQIQMEEVNYGDALFSPNSKVNFESDIERARENGESDESVMEAWDREFGTKMVEAYKNGEFTIDENGKVVYDGQLMMPINDTRRRYTTDFLKNKREIAFVIPNVESWNRYDDVHFGDAGEGRAVMWVRFGETTDKDGKKVLVIDEIQSNRHQEGREKGYKRNGAQDAVTKANIKRIEAQSSYDLYVSDLAKKYDCERADIYSYANDAEIAQVEEYKKAVENAETAYEKAYQENNGVPDAPFEKNWHEVAMKRMLRYAAENGYDKVAWTTGEQQAERYSLGHKVYQITSTPYEAQSPSESDGHDLMVNMSDGTRYEMFVQPDGTLNSNEELFDGKNVADVFGKELGNKIMSATEETDFSGNDLRVGAEGMKGFYDQILPRFMDKYGKKWGVKTTDVELPNIGDNGLTMHSVEVTPEMKRSVLEGQPMFHKVFHGSGADFERFDSSHMGEGEGAQAYGYGHYTTEVEGIGRTYAGQVDGYVNHNGRKLNYYDGIEISKAMDFAVKAMINARGDKAKAVDIINKNKASSLYPQFNKNLDEAIELINNGEVEYVETKSPTLYTVDIPDDNGSNYLTWNKTLPKAQRRRIADAVRGLEGEPAESVKYPKYKGGWQQLADMIERNQWAYQEVRDRLVQAFGGRIADEKRVSDLMHTAGFVGVKYPAEFRSGGREDGASNYVIFDDGDLKITDKIKFFKTPQGEVYGFTVGGNIYVDMDIAKADTPIHEYGHLWVPMVRESDPEMWEDIKRVLTKDKDVKPFMDIVRQRYPELTAEGREDDFMEEVFTHFSGDNGLKMLEEAAREYEEQDGQGFISKAKAIAALNKVKEALDKFWGKVAQLFGIKFRNAREVANKMFKDFMDEVDPTKVRTERIKNEGLKPEEEKTLMGVHNISEEKLRKAMKNGGFANPSMAVIDTKNGGFDSYGDISLIPRSSLIDARTGHNAGTYSGDAYTPIYPNVEYYEGKETEKKLQELTSSLPQSIGEYIRRKVSNYMDRNSNNSGLEYLFLKEHGVDMPIVHNERRYPGISTKQIAERMGVSEDLYGSDLYNEYKKMPEDQRFDFNLWLQHYGNEEDIAKVKNLIAEMQEKGKEKEANYLIDHYTKPMNFAHFDRTVYNISRDEREAGEENLARTVEDAAMEVNKQDLRNEFDAWQQKVIDGLGYEEKLFAGYTPSGYRKYLPNTAENASKLMNKQEDTNAGNDTGLNATRSALLYKMQSLDDIRQHRDLLQGNDAYGERQSEMTDELLDLAHQLSDMQKIDDNPFINTDYAILRMQDAFTKKDPIGYLNKEYGYSIDKDSEFAKQMLDFMNEVRDLPAKYFETKFKRPVALDEFAVAVVPEGTPQDVVDALKNAGLDVRTYDGTSENRQAVTLEAVRGRDDIMFQKADNKSTEREVEPYKAPKKNDGEDLIDYAKRVAEDYEEYKKRNEKPVDAGNGKGNDGNGNGNGGNVTVDKNDVPRAVARDSYERMMDSGANQFKEAVQDSMLSLKKLYEAILGKGTKIEDVEGYKNAYLAENRMHSASQAEIGMWHKDFMEPVVKAIHELTGGKRAAYDDLVKYMMAKHGLERNAVFAERDAQAAAKKGADYDDELQKNRGRDYAGLTALTGEDDVANAEGMAQKMVDDYEADHDTTELWNAINRATKQSLWKLASSGMMTPERYNEIRDMFSYYIPLQGFDETVAENVYSYMGNDGTIGYGTPIRHARGRKSLADDPIATIAMNGEAAIRQANRNEMKKRFLAFAQEHPSDLVSVSEVWLKHNDVTGEWEQVTADLNENDSPADVERKTREFDEKMEQLASNDPDHYKKASDIPNVPFRVVEPSDMKQHQVLVQRGGKKYMLTINGNPRAAQALNGLTNPDVFTEGVFGKAMNLGQWLNRQLSAFYTTRNPEFVLSNFLRDAIYSNSMSWVKESPNYALKFHKNFGKMNPVHMGKLFAQWENGKLRERIKNGTASETDQLFYDFMTNGGETGWTSLRDIEKHKKELQSSLKREGSTSRKAWKALGEAFDLMNRSVENCARFAAFVTSREMGRSIDRSISDAKEVSVNFNKKGAGDKFLTAKNQNLLGKVGASMGGLGRGLYVFFNASMQGLNNIARATKRHPGKAAGVYSTLFALGALAPILAEVLSGGDDDDDKNAYYNLPEYIRRSNICFRFGKDMPWITIPLPIEFRAIYGLGELSTGALTGKEHYTDEEFAKQYVSQLSQVLPLDFMEGGGGWHAFVPSMIKPYVEAQSNTSWTGLPIYRDNTFKPYDPEWTRAYSSANKQLVDATKWLNEATGGDDVTKGFIDWNPAKIEYMLKGYLGGYFTMYDRLQKTAETALGNRDFEWRNIPMASRVLREGDERTEARKLTNEYFDLVDEYNDTKHKVKEYEKISKSDREDAIKYAQKLAYLNNSEEYTRYLLMEYYKPILDQFHDMVKEADGEQSKRIKGEENALRRELINIIHSIDDGAEIDVDAAIDEMLMGILNDEQSDISLRKKAQNTIKKHRKAMAASQQ